MDGFSSIFYPRNEFKNPSENFSVPERSYPEWSLNGEKKRRAEMKEFIDPERDKRLLQDVSKHCPSPRDISAMAYPSYNSTSSYSNTASQSRSSKDSSILESPFYPLYSEYTASGYACDCLKCSSYRSKSNKMPRPVCCYVNAYSPSVSNSRATPSNNTFPFSYTSSPINDGCTLTQTTDTASKNDHKRETGFDFSDADKLLCKEDEGDETMTDMIQESDAINTTSVHDEETILPDSSCHSHEASSPREKSEVVGVSLDVLIDGNSSEFQELMKKKEKNSFLSGHVTNMKTRDSLDENNSEEKSNQIMLSHNAPKRKKEASNNNTEKFPIDIPRPPFSYVALIRMAIKSSPGKKATLQDIYKYIRENFEYYRLRGTGWQNSIRHNLTVNQCFQRLDDESGRRKGGYWLFNTDHEHEFQNDNWRRRVRMKRPHLKKHKNTSCSIANNVSPIITQTYHSAHPYSHHFWNYSADLFAHSYRSINSGDRNWFSSHMSDTFCHSNQSSLSTYSPCQSLQNTCQSLHMGCAPSTCVDATTNKSSETPFNLHSPYTADNYMPSGPALQPPQYLRDTTQQTAHHHRAY